MIYYFTPYSSTKNLGEAYNRHMELLPNDDDWAVLMDGDTMFLHPNYGTIIENIIKIYPETGLFTCFTNRVGNRQQLLRGKMDHEANIIVHKNLAHACLRKYALRCSDLKSHISGMIMIVRKGVWKNIRFNDGLLGIDNEFSAKILKSGLKIKLIRGLYVFHYYRLAEGSTYRKHLVS
jgi:GT2 family glycosyltransferase